VNVSIEQGCFGASDKECNYIKYTKMGQQEIVMGCQVLRTGMKVQELSSPEVRAKDGLFLVRSFVVVAVMHTLPVETSTSTLAPLRVLSLMSAVPMQDIV